MLTNTFCCFDGLTVSAERRLWSSGCLEWRELLLLDQPALTSGKLAKVRKQIHQAELALEAGLADWFLNRLRAPDSIRVLPHFLKRTGFLDIETTGLDRRDRITTVALSVNGIRRCYVRGENLDEFLRDVEGLSLLITFNGTSFDLPRLRSEFRIDLAQPHIDLRFCLEALGFKGGLKRCEELLGIRRRTEFALTGLDAVHLWRQYEKCGDPDVLSQLIKYNLSDVISLEILAATVFDLVRSSFPGRLKRRYSSQRIREGMGISEYFVV